MITQAVVLAGGKGTRLGDLTADTPKPMLPVGGRPFIEWVVDNLGRAGVTEVILAIGYRSDVFEGWLTTWQGPPAVSIFVEHEPLDTGGALTLMADRLDETFLVVNGDTLFDVPFQDLAALLLEGTDAAIALRPVADTDRYGRVGLDGDRVTTFAEKAAGGRGLINGGVYALRREVVASREAPLSLERDLLPELVLDGRVRGLSCTGFFIDIGVPASYERAQTTVPQLGRRL